MAVNPLARRDDPIVAIATAPGRAAVGIVRVSGADLGPLILSVCGRPLTPRHATLLDFLDERGHPIDRGLALHFPAPHSYTGEEVLELQAHGGPVVLQLLLARCLAALQGARLAEPGEFTERAYLNDKLDLAQAEAVADLIDASTEAAARSAGRSLSGEFSRQVHALAERLATLRTLVEATLDFPEEEIDFLQRADAQGQLNAIRSALVEVIDRAQQGALLREGLRVVLAGQPNVGKSSLLNALAGAELAIVTPIPGTTRDRVSESIQIEGVPLHVTDTAGLRRQVADEVERIGVDRSWGAIEGADVVLFMHDLTRAGDSAYDRAEREIAARLPAGAMVIDVWNKADAVAVDRLPTDAAAIVISAQTGAGLHALRRALLERAGWHTAPEGVFIARARHVQALAGARSYLGAAAAQLQAPAPALELLAEELRLAHEALGTITGVYTPEDLLGAIFSRFCIGK